MKTFKGFNKNMTCRGFQYEEGKSYETERASVCCEGFHACEHPLNCFDYYGPAASVFHEVEQNGEISEGKNKIASTKIKIGVRLSIADLVKAAIDFTKARIKPEATADEDYGMSLVKEHNGISSATGDYSVSLTKGPNSVSSVTGFKSVSSAIGNCSVSSAIDDYSASLATGDHGVSLATGNFSASSATGYYGVSAVTGCYSASSATGLKGISSTTGDGSISSVTSFRGISSTTGDASTSSVTGRRSVASATGFNSFVEANNSTALAVAWGCNSRAKGIKGSYLVLADWESNEDEQHTLKGVKLVHIDGKKYKENTWYEYSHGVVKEYMEEK